MILTYLSPYLLDPVSIVYFFALYDFGSRINAVPCPALLGVVFALIFLTLLFQWYNFRFFISFRIYHGFKNHPLKIKTVSVIL